MPELKIYERQRDPWAMHRSDKVSFSFIFCLPACEALGKLNYWKQGDVVKVYRGTSATLRNMRNVGRGPGGLSWAPNCSELVWLNMLGLELWLSVNMKWSP